MCLQIEAFLKAFIKKLLGSALNDYGGPEGSQLLQIKNVAAN